METSAFEIFFSAGVAKIHHTSENTEIVKMRFALKLHRVTQEKGKYSRKQWLTGTAEVRGGRGDLMVLPPP